LNFEISWLHKRDRQTDRQTDIYRHGWITM